MKNETAIAEPSVIAMNSANRQETVAKILKKRGENVPYKVGWCLRFLFLG